MSAFVFSSCNIQQLLNCESELDRDQPDNIVLTAFEAHQLCPLRLCRLPLSPFSPLHRHTVAFTRYSGQHSSHQKQLSIHGRKEIEGYNERGNHLTWMSKRVTR